MNISLQAGNDSSCGSVPNNEVELRWIKSNEQLLRNLEQKILNSQNVYKEQTFETHRQKTYFRLYTCTLSEDSDQPALSRIFDR